VAVFLASSGEKQYHVTVDDDLKKCTGKYTSLLVTSNQWNLDMKPAVTEKAVFHVAFFSDGLLKWI
jgi:hypothetical protein